MRGKRDRDDEEGREEARHEAEEARHAAEEAAHDAEEAAHEAEEATRDAEEATHDAAGRGASSPGSEVMDWQEPFSGPAVLEIDQHSPGPVAVTGWDQAEVKVHILKRVRGWGWSDRSARAALAGAEVNIDRSGNRVRVETRGNRPWDFWGGERISIEIMAFVPRGSEVDIDAGSSRVDVRGTQGPVGVDVGSGSVSIVRASGKVDVDTGSGNVVVEENEGPVEANVGSGSVQIRRVKGPVEIDGSSGSVTLAEIEGNVEIDTASGGVRMSRVLGDVSIDTGSGGVRLDTIKGQAVVVDTGSGSIEADFEVLPNGRYDYDTGSGSVHLVVPDDASFSFSGETGSGRIDCALPLSATHSTRRSLQGVLGNGSARITAETSSGALVIRGRSGGRAGWHAAPGPEGRAGAGAAGGAGGWVSAAQANEAVSRLKTENRDAVLKMVAGGKISAAQGEALLQAMSGAGAGMEAQAPPEPPAEAAEATEPATSGGAAAPDSGDTVPKPAEHTGEGL